MKINQVVAAVALDIDKRPMLVVDLASGSYLKTNQGHEALNLESNFVDGRYYGYCPPNDNIVISRLGAKPTDNSISGVVVVYTCKMKGSSDREIVAFCENATVYRHGNDGKRLKRMIIDTNGQKVYCSYSIESDLLQKIKENDPKFIIHLADYSVYMFRRQRFFKGTYPELDKKIFAFIRNYIARMNADDDLSFQEEIQGADPGKEITWVDTSTIEPGLLNGSNSPTAKKNSKVAKQALVRAGFKCEAAPWHKTFITSQGVPYMEGHHLIPCTYTNSQQFWNSKKRNIDCESNIVCLCPTCHRRIHYGTPNEKKALIETLFKRQKEKLYSVGLDISLEELWELYGV